MIRVSALSNDAPLSRASARELVSRVDQFDEVVFDFADVRSIGQSFADEIFRVFASEHPGVKLTAINANEQVTTMVRRAQASR